MEYTHIPEIDLRVSRIALGTWAIGGWMWGGTEDTESIQTIHRALDQGINLIDTAPVYGFGHSESIVGQAVKEYGHRESVIVATKAGLQWNEDGSKIVRNSQPSRIRQEIEDSLTRLQTDYIDLYQIHWPDRLVSFEETGLVLEKLKEEGKIRAAGVSNFGPEELQQISQTCFVSTNQPPYNLFERDIEVHIKPYCQEHNISLLTYGAICRGLLTGKMNLETIFPGDDLRNFDPKFKMPLYQEYLEGVKTLDAFAQEQFGKHIIHLAVRWILDQNVSIALWGARHPEQLNPVEEVFGWSLAPDALTHIDTLLAKTITSPVGPEFMAPPHRQ
jgi:aryl-alcohol dehydrogenase-like predicted oxidoreductase